MTNTLDHDHTAALIFDRACFVALTKVADMTREALSRPDANVADVSLTALELRDTQVRIRLDLCFYSDNAVLTVALASLDGSVTPPVELAALVHALASRLPVESVEWADTGLRIPRDRFVEGLASAFAGRVAPGVGASPHHVDRGTPRAERTAAARGVTSPPTAQRATTAPRPAPRRVTRREGQRPVARPPAAKQRPADCDDGVPKDPAQTRDGHLRDTLIRDATDGELSEVAQSTAPPPIEIRLTTWALSICVAVVALPLALPLVVHNLKRGEDMRAASLAAGVAGLFVALSSSGAMATLPGF